jgi:glycine betaine catabolism B
MKLIDTLLNRITMYRLALYYLIFLIATAILLSFAGLLAYDSFALLFSTGFLLAVCGLTNWLFAKAYGVPANAESANISALILALIITPITGYHDLIFLFWAGVVAMASKYIVAINHKHLFNPVAFAVALTYFAVNQSASWWVGQAQLLPFVLMGGLLLVRKLRRGNFVTSFLLSATVAIVFFSLLAGQNPLTALQQTLLYSPVLFFAFIILTEPLTTPPTSGLRVIEGLLVGVLFAPQLHFGSFYMTPELAMLLGNVFAYLVSPKAAFVLKLKQKIQIAPDVYDFIFAAPRRFAFVPGQYMEWTLGHNDSDTRGNRRYFTLASSPTEKELRLGVKFYNSGSSYKQAMLAMNERTEIAATQLAGDFVLPQDETQKCVLIAGGIGITPYRSMLKYLLDKGERRNLVLFYANKSAQDIVYKDVLDQARRELGVKTIYTVSDKRNLPAGWKGQVGRITPQMIQAEVPDYKDCMFYISGPQSLVDSMKDVLAQLRVPNGQIKTDLFAGLA